MDEAAYKKLQECVFTSDINVCDDVPSGAGRSCGAKLTNPLGGTAHQVDGADRYIRVTVPCMTVALVGFVSSPSSPSVYTTNKDNDSQRISLIVRNAVVLASMMADSMAVF